MDVMAYPPDVNSGGTLRNVPPLLSHRSLFAISFDGYVFMKKMQKMIAVLFSVAMCAAMAVPAFAAETDTARNEEQETVMPRAIVYEEINIPGDGKFYKITDDFEMPAKSRVSFQGTWSPAYARLEFRLYAHSTGNGAYVMLTSGREGGLDATAASVYSLYARSVDNVKVTGAVNITN